jgi:hypothetical protein
MIPDVMKNNYMWIGIGLIVLVVVAFVVYKRMMKEHLEVVPRDDEHSVELVQPAIDIKPTFIDEETKIIQSGPEFTPNALLSPYYAAYTGNMKNYYLLDDGAGGQAGLHFDRCSKSCCSPQYPTPFKMPADEAVCMNKDEYVPTNYTCNNAWDDTGCVCMTKEQANHIGSRGGNA